MRVRLRAVSVRTTSWESAIEIALSWLKKRKSEDGRTAVIIVGGRIIAVARP